MGMAKSLGSGDRAASGKLRGRTKVGEWTLRLREPSRKIDRRRLFFITLGVFLFAAVYFAPPLPDAIDPAGTRFELTEQGKAALALFLIAAVWWVFEVIPIGVTSITIGVIQALFLIRPRFSLKKEKMLMCCLMIRRGLWKKQKLLVLMPV